MKKEKIRPVPVGKVWYNESLSDAMAVMNIITGSGKDRQVRFELQDNLLTITVSQREIQARCSLTVNSEGAFDFTARMGLLPSAFNKRPVGELEVYDSRVHIKGIGFDVAMQLSSNEPRYEFPVFDGEFHSLPSDTFAAAMLAKYATGEELENRPQLSRVSVSVGDGKVTIYGSDSHRIVRVTGESEFGGEEVEFLLPPSLIEGLAKLLRKSDDTEILMGETPYYYLLKVRDMEVSVARLAGKSFKTAVDDIFRNHIKADAKTPTVVLQTADVQSFIESSTEFQYESSKPTARKFGRLVFKLDKNAGIVRGECKHPTGEVVELLLAGFGSDAPLKSVFACSSRYLSDVCRNVSTPNLALCLGTTESSLILIKEDVGDFEVVHVISPVLLRGEEAEEWFDVDYSDTRGELAVPKPIDMATVDTSDIPNDGEF